MPDVSHVADVTCNAVVFRLCHGNALFIFFREFRSLPRLVTRLHIHDNVERGESTFSLRNCVNIFKGVRTSRVLVCQGERPCYTNDRFLRIMFNANLNQNCYPLILSSKFPDIKENLRGFFKFENRNSPYETNHYFSSIFLKREGT